MPNVRLYANLRSIAGLKETTIPGITVHQALLNLALQYPALTPYLLEDGHVRFQLIITINGQPTKEFDTSIDENDIISIFPPLSGGCPGGNKERL